MVRSLSAKLDELEVGATCPGDWIRLQAAVMRAAITAREELVGMCPSPAQRETVKYAAAGATLSEIAQALGRKPETVRTHLREAYRRLGVSSRLELARALREPARLAVV